MTRIRIPGLVDLVTIDDAAGIAAAAADARLDRRYLRRGPLLNRLILGRVRRVLALQGKPLPPVSERGSQRPVETQAATLARLKLLIGEGLAGAEIAALAAWVRGQGHAEEGGILAQQAVGRLFDPAYRADADSWAAALVLRDAPSTFNPLRRLVWALTGRVEASRDLLAAKVGQDPTGLHATGVAIHNLAEGFARMRALYADAALRGLRSTAAAVSACLVAPPQVLRQPVEAGRCPAGELSPDTLVLLRLGRAHAATPSQETAFLTHSWSACPAADWVPALLSAVWREALKGDRP